MPKEMNLNAGTGTTSVSGVMPVPVWQKLSSPSNSERWEIRMYSHQLLGALSAKILWLKDDCTGTITLYRNNEFLTPIELDAGRESPQNSEEFKDRAWESILDFVASASVYLQNYIAYALKTNPGSEGSTD